MPKALILGLAGAQLTNSERRLFAEADPLGFILFSRNCGTPDQVRALTADLRSISGRGDVAILIDQEGGRVARLGAPHWRVAPNAAAFGVLYRQSQERGLGAVELNARLIGAELHDLGINVDCAPVLDLPRDGADPIIGDRAFSDDAMTISALGLAFCEGLLAAGVLPVLKHIPGHGRAEADSHVALPRVATPWAELAATDFVPFRALSRGLSPKPWAMTAHVVFTAMDSDQPATLSKAVIDEVIRRAIGFDGIVISDDLSMKALSGPIGTRSRDAFAAGCDLILHCNGDMAEMAAAAQESPDLSVDMTTKLAASLGALGAPEDFDRDQAVMELESYFKEIGGSAT
ncbi:MAG: beta-N-acetylhexosaminidase [Alphaproteobacteria bacterium]|nr:beta-N-acetylhexosaminidase [Alphaproteobacteria bacterium]